MTDAPATEVARADLHAAESRLAAASAGKRQADDNLAAYQARVDQGLSTTPATLGDRRSSVELADLELASAERAVTAARERLEVAVLSAANAAIRDGSGGLADREVEVRAKIAEALTEAVSLATAFIAERDAVIRDWHDAANEAGVPRYGVQTSKLHGRISAWALPITEVASLAVVGAVPAATPIEIDKFPNLAVRAGGVGVVVDQELIRSSWDADAAARDLITSVLRSE